MTVTHIQLLLGKRACVDKETDREKKGLVYSLFKDGKGLLKFTFQRFLGTGLLPGYILYTIQSLAIIEVERG